jgi:uncharacterized small protein (DUF1192 family)
MENVINFIRNEIARYEAQVCCFDEEVERRDGAIGALEDLLDTIETKNINEDGIVTD